MKAMLFLLTIVPLLSGCLSNPPATEPVARQESRPQAPDGVAILRPAAAADLYEPLFHIVSQGKWGLMDRNGAVVVPMKFDGGRSFGYFAGLETAITSKLIPAALGGRSVYIDRKGNIAIDTQNTQYSGGRKFREGRAVVFSGSGEHRRCGYIDEEGRVVVKIKYIDCKDFHEGMAAVKEEETGASLHGYIDRHGEYVIEKAFYFNHSFSEGLAVVRTPSDYWPDDIRFINKRGEFAFPKAFTYAEDFSEGLAYVNTRKERGYINTAGEMVIHLARGTSGQSGFHEGLAAAFDGKSRKVGYIDRAGNWHIKPQFVLAREFHEGRAVVHTKEPGGMLTNDVGIIDKNGDWVVPPQFEHAQDYSHGLARVSIWRKYGKSTHGYIDRDGNYVWGPFRADEPVHDVVQRNGSQ